jgi:hypothetical protein
MAVAVTAGAAAPIVHYDAVYRDARVTVQQGRDGRKGRGWGLSGGAYIRRHSFFICECDF